MSRPLAAMRSVALLALALGTGAAVAGCGDHIDVPGANGYATVEPSAAPTSAAPAPTSPAATATAAAGPTTCAPITPNPPAKGEPAAIQVTTPPTALVTHDIKTGTGATAKSGSSVTIKYVGIACSTGKAFDASYTDGAPNQEFTFPLGAGQVIPGFDQGIVGMKVGGTRQIVIPPNLGYGAQGSGSAIGPNETLIFVVTLDKA